jgi:hypothetical protein
LIVIAVLALGRMPRTLSATAMPALPAPVPTMPGAVWPKISLPSSAFGFPGASPFNAIVAIPLAVAVGVGPVPPC